MTITYMDKGDAAFSGTHEAGCPTTHAYGVETPLKGAEKQGHIFGGWYIKPDCSGTALKSLAANGYYGDITLYADWIAEMNTVTLSADDATSTGWKQSVNATYGKDMPALTAAGALPKRTGYAFAGYFHEDAATGGKQYYNADGTSASIWDKTTAATLYARWTANKYAVTLDKNGGTADGAVTATYGLALPAFAALTRDNHSLNGYYTAASGGVMVIDAGGTLQKSVSGYSDAAGMWIKDGDAMLYAQWTVDTYKVTLSDSDIGIIGFEYSADSTDGVNGAWTAYTTPVSVNHGGSLWIKAMLKVGYTFEKWDTNITANPYHIQNITKDIDYTPTTNAPIVASVSPTSAAYDKYTPSDLAFTLSPGTYSLTTITSSTGTLASGTDYTVSGNVYTVKQSYLNAQTTGSTITLTFDMNGGTDPTANITISDTTPDTISLSEVTGVIPPVAQVQPSTAATCASASIVTPVTASWSPAHTRFQLGTQYTVSVILKAKAGYEFAALPALTATINGNAAMVNRTSDKQITVSFTFPKAGMLPFKLIPSSNFEANNAPETIFTVGEGTGLNPSDLKEVLLGGRKLNEFIDITVTSGSVVITLKRAYLNTLKPGTYALRATMHSGAYAETQITVYSKPPKTGDGSAPLLWLSLCELGMVGIGVMVVRRRRRA